MVQRSAQPRSSSEAAQSLGACPPPVMAEFDFDLPPAAPLMDVDSSECASAHGGASKRRKVDKSDASSAASDATCFCGEPKVSKNAYCVKHKRAMECVAALVSQAPRCTRLLGIAQSPLDFVLVLLWVRPQHA